MEQLLVILVTLVTIVNAASPGYRYQQPQRQQPQPIRPALPQSNSGIYSGVQVPPLAAPSPPLPPPILPPPAPPAISLPAPPPPAPPLSLPEQNYLPPHQHQQEFAQQPFQQQPVFQQQQPVFQQQQPVFQQQLSQPIQNSGFQQNFQTFQRPPSAIITKDIFIHSAPEDNGSDADFAPQIETGPIRKNYRIVFIKAPSQNLRGAAAAVKRAQNQHEEKTIIYVLSKKPDLSEVSQQLQQAQVEHKVNKPEVYFIKYKTQEEAQRAQQEIQAQYDALGGSTHISDEGIAPVRTVGNGGSGGSFNLGQIGGSTGGNGQQQSFGQQNFQSQGSSGISQKYLPVKK